MGNANAQLVALPQNDVDQDTRERGLDKARELYKLQQKQFGLTQEQTDNVNLLGIPPLLRSLPRKEWRSFCKGGFKVWQKENVVTGEQNVLQKQQADHWFAWQRMNGVTRNLITRVQAQNIPQRLLDFIGENHPYLENIDLDEHIEAGNLYIVDLPNIGLNNGGLQMEPLALFVVWNNKLMPAGIQLTNDVPWNVPIVEGNAEELIPWVNARILFNLVEAQYHESITHLGFTHLLMDGVSVCMHRQLSNRHPIFKLLHPHFRYMHVINSEGLASLMGANGFVDADMSVDHVNMLNLIANHNLDRTYDFDADIEASFGRRGVMNLPGYYFRDDALEIRSAINQFVTEYVKHYYTTDDDVIGDLEIQVFRQELTKERGWAPDSGCGMQGLPEFDRIDNLATVLTNFIYICSVEHSATNFPQFDQYAFPPNFPARLNLDDQDNIIMNDINAMIPTRAATCATNEIMKLLTLRLTNSLGKYEEPYLKAMDDFGKASVQTFNFRLDVITANINLRNRILEVNNAAGEVKNYPYTYLLPENVLNSISI